MRVKIHKVKNGYFYSVVNEAMAPVETDYFVYKTFEELVSALASDLGVCEEHQKCNIEIVNQSWVK